MSNMVHEILKPIEVNNKRHVIGLTIDHEEKTITINHHTRTLDTNQENNDNVSIKIYQPFLESLINRMTVFANHFNQHNKPANEQQ